MADNFDKLIKEKFEEKQFAYNAKAWRSFQRKSGKASISVTAKIAATVISAIIIGSIAFYINFEKRSGNAANEATPQTIETPQEPIAEITVDTFAANNETETTQQFTKKSVAKEEKKTTKKATAKKETTKKETAKKETAKKETKKAAKSTAKKETKKTSKTTAKKETKKAATKKTAKETTKKETKKSTKTTKKK